MSEGRFTTRDGVSLAYESVGAGLPVLWQHGLGADRTQPAEVFPECPGIQRITLECRGHGNSDLGPVDFLTIERLTEDAISLLDHLQIERAVVGGISLGAAIALRIAALYPQRCAGLILARPAWVAAPSLDRLAAYVEVGELVRDYGVTEGRRRFEASPHLARVEAVSPDNAKSLRWFFDRSRPDTTVALLTRLPKQWPAIELAQIKALRVPTLIIGNDHDFVHPLKFAEELADHIFDAKLALVTSKSLDRDAYVSEFRSAIAAFLEKDLPR